MTQKLTKNAQRVQDALDQHGLALQVVEMPSSTRTAQEAADSVGCEIAQIIKSLIFVGKESQKPILVLVSGSNRVNEKALAAVVGEPIGKANANFVKEKTGFTIGGVPPVGHLEKISTYIDQDLLSHEDVWAAAGMPNALFKLASGDIEKLTGGMVISVG